MGLILSVGAIAAGALFLLGLRSLTGLVRDRRRVVSAVVGFGDDSRDLPWIQRVDRWFRTTRPGEAVARELALAGIDQRPAVVVLVAAAVGVTTAYVLWVALAPVFGLLGVAAGFFGLRAFIQRAKERRLEAFIVQMPELARVLANATNAGLSISTAIGIAADELDAPAGAELEQVSHALGFGTDLETALDEVAERLPSREVSVLLSTLVVCARSGGSLVTSLREIADTLEDRKETRREIRTTLAQSLATGYLIIALGFGMLFLLNGIQPGSVQAMTSSLVGQIALAVSASMYIGGFLIIRRLTRIDV